MLDRQKILVTGGAGFIGSNLVDHFLESGHEVVCLDNLSTGFMHNISHNLNNSDFKFIEGDIRDLHTCKNAMSGCDFVSHQAALGSVPRSIADPITTNDVNLSGFLNILVAARDEKVKRFVYAASSSTYGDSKKMPKVEEEIGRPLSPYAITKYVNELYTDVFAKTYDMQCIGLRYFNVFGQRQSPSGAYAAVIPVWVEKLMRQERPTINGDGSYSRDFTYIDNVVQANEKALFISTDSILQGQKEYYNLDLDQHKFLLQKPQSHVQEHYFSEVFNIAYGGNTTLLKLYESLRASLATYDKRIAEIEPLFASVRVGDIPHSLASILKAKTILNYTPKYDAKLGFENAVKWYFENLQHD